MRFDWRNAYGTDASAGKQAGAAVAAWLKDVADYDGDVTVAIEETASCLVGTARFHGHGDAPFDAARAILTNNRATDVLIILFEHAFAPSLPDTLTIGAGAIALHLTASDTDELPDAPTPNGVISAILGVL